MHDIFHLIKIDQKSRKPKYKQIVDSVIHHIATGDFTMNQQLPSINSFSEEFYLSRNTVEKAYNILKERKIISPTRGKGFYITRTKLIRKTNILFLINKLSTYKMRIYNSFINSLGSDAHVDLHIYHCDQSIFLNLLEKNKDVYDYYVLMPHFKTDALKHTSSTDDILKAIKQIPSEKLVLMDNNKIDLNNDHTEIFQDFKRDIYNALKMGLPKITMYQKLFLVYPETSVYPYPKRILHGFRKFCVEQSQNFEVIDEIYDDMILKKGDLFIIIEESDLVNLVKQIREKGMNMGDDIGVISYNETPLKELLGITVISTDFRAMGEKAAQMILNKKKGKIKNPFNFIDRHSV